MVGVSFFKASMFIWLANWKLVSYWLQIFPFLDHVRTWVDGRLSRGQPAYWASISSPLLLNRRFTKFIKFWYFLVVNWLFLEFYSYRRHLFCVSLLFGAFAAVHLGSHKFRFNGRAMLLTLSFKWFDLIWCMGLRGVSPSKYNTHTIYKWKTALLMCWKEWKKGLKLNGYSTINTHKRAFRIN